MSDIKELIVNLIDKLDEDKDALLIEMLNQKSETFIYNIEFTNEDLNRAASALYSIAYSYINNTILPFHEYPNWYVKIKKITDKYDCNTCTYHELIPLKSSSGKDLSYYNCNYDSPTCHSCLIRCEKLNDYNDKYDRILLNHLKNSYLNDEIIKLKAIIIKLNQKLKNYETS